MNFALDDIHRSLRRYVSQALGSPPWRVRVVRQNVTNDDRPVAVVEPASTATVVAARATIPQGDVTKAQSYSVMAYPELGDTAAESGQIATQVAQLLLDAFQLGLVDEEGAFIGAPERLPVYDFAGVAVVGPIEERIGPDEPYGYLWIDDIAVRPLQDAEDPLRFTVACDLRLSWQSAGRERPAAPMVGSLSGSFATP